VTPTGQGLQKATALFISQVHNSLDMASLTQENGRLNENGFESSACQDKSVRWMKYGV
jgi:hypothetical protein